jgi:hypothetical protein
VFTLCVWQCPYCSRIHPQCLVVSVLLIVVVFCVVLCRHFLFVCLRPVSCVLNVAGISGLSILDCSSVFSNVYFDNLLL